MTSKKRTTVGALTTEDQAQRLEAGIRALGDYGHVSVRPARGHLNIFAGDDQPVARLTPLAGQYGLSFMHHTGRWEPMPFVGISPKWPTPLSQPSPPISLATIYPAGSAGQTTS